MPSEVLITIFSSIGAVVFFLVKHLLATFSKDIKELKESVNNSTDDIQKDIARINVTLAINAHAVNYLSDEMKLFKQKD